MRNLFDSMTDEDKEDLGLLFLMQQARNEDFGTEEDFFIALNQT